MKRFARSAAAAAAFALVAATAAPLPSMASEGGEMCAEIAAEISQPGVCVSENDGIITLTGVVESQTDKEAAERAAMKFDGVTEVRNLISVSN